MNIQMAYYVKMVCIKLWILMVYLKPLSNRWHRNEIIFLENHYTIGHQWKYF